MNSFEDLCQEFQVGITMAGLRARMDDFQAQAARLKAEAALSASTTDCGGYRLRVVPWDGQP